MSKKFKKDKKVQKAIRVLSGEQLFDQARIFLEKGKPRDAIDVLKRAERQSGTSEPLQIWLFRAYLMREEQLRSKDMIQEADFVRRNLATVMPPIGLLSEADVIAYLSHASVEEAVRFHQRLTKEHPFSCLVERQIAYRLMASDDWRPLERLAPDHPLRQDAPVARKAIDSMNEGNWESALQELKPIPRRSPYAPLRLFCKAMTLFLGENDTELLQVIPRLPSDFPLNPILEDIRDRLQGTTQPTKPARAESINSPSAMLWEQQTDAERHSKALLQALKHRHIKAIALYAAHFARAIYPEDPSFAILYLLECMWTSEAITLNDILEMRSILTPLISSTDYDILENKIGLLVDNQIQPSIRWYSNLLEKTISDPILRNRVQAMICLFGAQKLYFLKEHIDRAKGSDSFFRFMNPLNDMEQVNQDILNLVVQSIELDPLNRDAYSFLLKLPNYSREAKDTIEKALLTMADTFPDDPYPCLELSNLYYRKNAFRKAERVLEEAARRAPHDRRVIERRAMAFVISACKTFYRSRMETVFNDLERAESFGSKTLAPLIEEKRILFHLLNQPDRLKELSFEDIPERLSTIDRIRVLALLYQEVRDNTIIFRRKHIQAVQDRLKMAIQKASLDPNGIVELLSPFPNIYQPVLPHQPIAHPLLSTYDHVWKDFSNEKLIETFLVLFHPDIIGFMADELRKRIRKKNPPQAMQMRFFLVTLSYMNSFPYTDERYLDVLSKADENDQKELERLSRRLGAYANGLLKHCLMTFDFNPLENSPLNPFTPGVHDHISKDDDEEWEEDDFFDDPYKDELQGMAGMLADILPHLKKHAGLMTDMERREFKSLCEKLVEELELTGKPMRIILSVRRELLTQPVVRQLLDAMVQIIQNAGISGLSREANTLIFGN
ncbi:MAG: hypothetical protein AB1547_01310 [Thermodesulfobacteriota bacterium]